MQILVSELLTVLSSASNSLLLHFYSTPYIEDIEDPPIPLHRGTYKIVLQTIEQSRGRANGIQAYDLVGFIINN